MGKKYRLVMIDSLLLKPWPIEIVVLPNLKDGDFPVWYMKVYQRLPQGLDDLRKADLEMDDDSPNYVFFPYNG